MYPIHYIFTREETWDWARRTQRGAWKAKHWDTIKIEMYRIHRPYKIKMYRASFEICIDFFHQLTTYLAVLRAGYISAVKNIIKFSIEMVFRHQNCSNLLWEKNVLVTEKNFRNLRQKTENLQKFWDHQNNLFKQWKVRIIIGNRMLF